MRRKNGEDKHGTWNENGLYENGREKISGKSCLINQRDFFCFDMEYEEQVAQEYELREKKSWKMKKIW